jgi:hypothetical protein
MWLAQEVRWYATGVFDLNHSRRNERRFDSVAVRLDDEATIRREFDMFASGLRVQYGLNVPDSYYPQFCTHFIKAYSCRREDVEHPRGGLEYDPGSDVWVWTVAGRSVMYFKGNVDFARGVIYGSNARQLEDLDP